MVKHLRGLNLGGGMGKPESQYDKHLARRKTKEVHPVVARCEEAAVWCTVCCVLNQLW